MKHDEMIEAVALDLRVAGICHTRTHSVQIARAAIRKIAPAVLDDVAALEESRSWSVGLKAHEIRALKTRYEQ